MSGVLLKSNAMIYIKLYFYKVNMKDKNVFLYSVDMQLPSCLPVRYIFSILAFIGFVFNYTLRINMNVVILAMVNHTALNDTHSYKLDTAKKAVSDKQQ